jgi:RNA polymerase sigma-70 factor (ECF subfamily)
LESDERRRFEAIVLPHADAAYNLARWLTRDADAAEDLVQEAFYRAARYFHSFRGADARPWLLGIVRRATFDWMKNRPSTIPLDMEVHDTGDDSLDPMSAAVGECGKEDVRQALENLPPLLREVIVLREFESFSYQQIADVIESPVGTVMSRLSRGRRQLQILLTSAMDGGRR